jgi:hypothetical protein
MLFLQEKRDEAQMKFSKNSMVGVNEAKRSGVNMMEEVHKECPVQFLPGHCSKLLLSAAFP